MATAAELFAQWVFVAQSGDDGKAASSRGTTLWRNVQVTQVKCLQDSFDVDETPDNDSDIGKHGEYTAAAFTKHRSQGFVIIIANATCEP